MKADLYADVEYRLKKGNKILFARESPCLKDFMEIFEKASRRALVLWALDAGKTALNRFNEDHIGECRPKTALEFADAWSRGYIKMPTAKRAILDAHAAARELKPCGAALCHAIAQAASAVHVGKHAAGLVFYELTAMVLECREDYEKAVEKKIEYYKLLLLHYSEHCNDTDREWASFL